MILVNSSSEIFHGFGKSLIHSEFEVQPLMNIRSANKGAIYLSLESISPLIEGRGLELKSLMLDKQMNAVSASSQSSFFSCMIDLDVQRL